MSDIEYDADVTVGRRIRERREQLGLSQLEAAARMGVPRSTLNSRETSVKRVWAGDLVIFARALQTTPNELLGWTDAPGTCPSHHPRYRTMQCQMRPGHEGEHEAGSLFWLGDE
jgi:transcriptional regulator with XRE-family HTH domain